MPSGARSFIGYGDVQFVVPVDAGSGYGAFEIVPATFSDPLPRGTRAAGYMLTGADGSFFRFIITDPGSFYASAPTVTVPPPPAGGDPTTLTATIRPIGVTAVTVSDVGYLVIAQPTVTIAPPDAGTRAMAHLEQQADCTGTFWTVTGVTITSGGDHYTDPQPPPTLICTIVADAGTFGPFTLSGATPVSGICGPFPTGCRWGYVGDIGGVPGRIAFFSSGIGCYIAIVVSGTEREFRCDPTGVCTDCPDGGNPTPGWGPNHTCECESVSGACFEPPFGFEPGDGPNGGCVSFGPFPPCTGRPYAASLTACYDYSLTASGASPGWRLFGGGCETWHVVGGWPCHGGSVCLGPFLNITISEP
jgi:hypothetical protein